MTRPTNPRRIKTKKIKPRYQKKEIIDMLKDTDRERQVTAKQRDNNGEEIPVISGDLQAKNEKSSSFTPGNHPNTIKNRFQKGVSGNPKGRPVKDRDFREALKKYGSIEPDAWKDTDSNFNDVVKTLWERARSGDLQTIKYLVNLGVMNQSEKPK